MDPTNLTLEKCREFIEQKLFNDSKKPGNREFVGLVGLELESIPVFCPFPGHHQNISDLFGHDFSVANALFEISRRKDQKITGYPGMISLSGGSGFQFEPGGQTEITTRPCQNLTELKNELAFCQEIQEKVTEEFSIQFIQHGINPWFNEFEIGLQNKRQRYKTMAHYFDEIGPYGRKMMVQSCSMHINLDFGEDWDTRISRFILSNLLVPFSSVLFANSAIVSGKKSMHKSYRRFLWNHLDPTRTGILDLKGLSGLPDKDWIIDKYLEFVLNAPLIYINGTDESEAPLKISFDKWLKKPVCGRSPVLADLENHLSLLFPEVRPKGYLEIRTVDVPPKGWEFVPLIFYTGLLYHQHTMEKAIKLLLPLSRDLNGMIHDASYGYKTDLLYSYALALVNYAIEGYNCLPAKFKGDIPVDQLIEFKESYVLKKLCFADDSIINYTSE